jgi:hypothetical protein
MARNSRAGEQRDQIMERCFPPEFDAVFYKSIHADLWDHDAAALVHHYETFGRAEGRRATPAVPREEFVALFPSEVPTLEIGPFNNPMVAGEFVRYFDVLGTDGLIERAKRLGLGYEKVPHIDYIDSTGDMSGISEKFDVIIGSHIVEHQPDLVRHLIHVRNLLSDNGFYFCIIPDKRYCFDHFIAESSIADVIDAHLSGRRVHTLASIIEHAALTTHNDSVRHWNGDHGGRPDDAYRVRGGIEEYRAAEGRYLDVHAWQFTPNSFKAIINMLEALRYINLKLIRVYDTPYGGIEFYTILKREKSSDIGG